MKPSFTLLFAFFVVLNSMNLHAQPGCPSVNAGANQSLPCGTNCTNLTATAFPSGNTTTYSVASIPYTPFSYTAGTSILVNTDDIWSSVINLPFTFCFFGNAYNQLILGANGLLSFDVSNAGLYCAWDLTLQAPLPNPNLYTNAIMGPYHDIDPSLGGTIKYQILGTAPCRIFVLSFSSVPMYDDVFLIGSCYGIGKATHQIVLYETTNAIEIYIQQKRACTGWNDGLAIEGIQNATGTVAYTVPGRNLSVWNATNDAYRFTPNGASIVTVDWLQAGNVIGAGNTINVCPSANPTTYTARATYLPCNGGTPVVVTSNVNVSLAGSLNSSITASTNVSCNGGSNGTATATVSGGNSPITYGWSNGSNQLSISGLSAGTYVFTANDAANCVRRDTVRITQPPPRTLSVPNVTFNNCSGTGNGDLVAISSGGVYPYTYAWSSTAQTDSILDGVAAGTYTVTMTDANSCSSTASGTLSITNNPIVFASPAITSATCTQGGSIVLSVSGGVGSLSYAWSNGATGSSITNVTTGTYSVTATDQGGCTASATYNVGSSGTVVSLQPPTLTNVQCNGGNNGSITANGTGGTGTLSYSWNGGQNTATIGNLIAGSYSVTVSDPTGCSASASYTLTQPTAIVVGTPVIVDATCATNGSITASASGGSGSFGYTWSNGQNTAAASNLTAGSYTVTITDQTSLCSVTRNYNVALIGSPPNLFVASPPALTCATTSQTITATSSTPSVTYVWSTGSTTDSISATQGGTYTVTATNPADGCTASSSVVVPIDTVTPFIVSVEPDTINCLNANSTLFVATSASNASFLWSNGDASNSSVVNMSGSYTVTVTDNNNGCTASYTETVVEDIAVPSIAISAPQELTCIVLSTNLVASSSASPVNFVWNNGVNNATNAVSSPGNYTVTVTNTQNGCTASASEAVTQNIATPGVSIDPSVFMTCVNSSQVLTANSPLGAATFNWSNGSNTQTTTVNAAGTISVTATDPSNGCTSSASETVLADLTPPAVNIATPAILTCTVLDVDLIGSTNATTANYVWSNADTISTTNVSSPGQYTLTVTNIDNGCTASNFVIVVQNIAVPSISISTPNPIGCAVLSQTLVASSNASSPSYSWSNGASNASNVVTSSGLYTVTVTNTQNGCTATSSQTVVDAPILTFTDTVTKPLCNTFPKTGAIVLEIVTGTPGFSFLWSDSSRLSSKTNLTPGIYAVTVSDAQGCTAVRSFTLSYEFDYTIQASPMAVIDLGESTTLSYTINGNSGSLTNVWKPFRYLDCENCASVIATPLFTMLYNIETTNQYGCLASDTVTVVVNPLYDLYVPNAFTPNQDGFNDLYEIFGNKKIWKFVEMKIFNRWGEKVFESNDINFKWDGKYRGELLTPQVLTYTLQLTFINGFTDKLQKGTITVIR